MTRLVQWGKQYNDDDDVQFYGVREECILLLSCKHMCLCKECERKLSYCLLCQSSKFLGIVIYTRRVHALAGTVETGKWMTRLLGYLNNQLYIVYVSYKVVLKLVISYNFRPLRYFILYMFYMLRFTFFPCI